MNKCLALFPVLWLLASNVFAQAGGAVTGTVIDPDGNPVAGATVNVKLTPAGTAGSAVSTAKGDFTISGMGGDDRQKNVENSLRDSPTALCLPGWVIPAQPILYKFVQTPALIVLLFELEPHNRQIFMDGRSHPADPDPTWVGHSVGKWEGDTLVVDTIGYNDRSWLPTAIPHTEKLHVIERYRRPDLAHL